MDDKKRTEELLLIRYPQGELKLGGRFCYFKQSGLEMLSAPMIEKLTGMKFFIGTFFTGHNHFTFTPMIIGLTADKLEIVLQCNPMFSDEYSGLADTLKGKQTGVDFSKLCEECVQMLRKIGSVLTPIDHFKGEYQIWRGDREWRKLKFGSPESIDIDSTPSYSKTGFWQKLKSRFNA